MFSNDLFKLRDDKYFEYQTVAIPNISKESIIGVQLPRLREYSKNISSNMWDDFVRDLPHQYLEENLLHGIYISNIKDYNKTLIELNRFLKYVDNWLVADSISPISFKGHENELIKEIRYWISSKDIYKARFGIKILMTYYLDDYFKEDYLMWVSNIETDDYYLSLMVAWFYATALYKQYDKTIVYLKNHDLDEDIYNKTVQKAIESYRISDEIKEELRKIKR